MSKLRSLLTIIKTSSPNSRDNSIEIYNDTQKKLTGNSKFVSNNALMLLNDESIFLETEYNVAQYPLLFNLNNNITNYCKTLPASLYDGAGGKCGSIKSCIENSSGYEFSNYNIKFVIKEMQNNNNSPYLILKSIMVKKKGTTKAKKQEEYSSEEFNEEDSYGGEDDDGSIEDLAGRIQNEDGDDSIDQDEESEESE